MSSTAEELMAEIVACDDLLAETRLRREALYDSLGKQIDPDRTMGGTAYQCGDFTVLVDTNFQMLACLRYKVIRNAPLPVQLTLEHTT